MRFPAVGEYAGRARYLPGDLTALTPVQRIAIGMTVEVCFVGIAPSGPFRGQRMYRKTGDQQVAGQTLIPENDLDFIKCAPTTRI